MVVLVEANKMNARDRDFDWTTPKALNAKFGERRTEPNSSQPAENDDSDYDWFSEGQNDFSDFEHPRIYDGVKSNMGQQNGRNGDGQSLQQVQGWFPATDDFCSDVESDSGADKERRSSRSNRTTANGTQSNLHSVDSKNIAIDGGDTNETETAKIGDKDLRRKLRRDARAKAKSDAAWGIVPEETNCRGSSASTTAAKDGVDKSRSRGRSKTKIPAKAETKSKNSPTGIAKSSKVGRSTSTAGQDNAPASQTALRRTTSAPLKDSQKSERDRSSSRNSRASRRPSMRSVAPSERSKSPKNALLDRTDSSGDESGGSSRSESAHRTSQMGSCRSASSRSLVAVETETDKRRNRNRERRRSMSGSRRTETNSGPSLLGDDSTEVSDDKCEDELDLSTSQRKAGSRSSKFEMVRSGSSKQLKPVESSNALGPMAQQEDPLQSSSSLLLTLPDAPNLDELDPKEGRKSNGPRRLNRQPSDDEAKKDHRDASRSRRDGARSIDMNSSDHGKHRDASRSRRDGARSIDMNSCDHGKHREPSRTRRDRDASRSRRDDNDMDTSRSRESSRTRQRSTVGSTSDNDQIANVPDIVKRASGYLPTTLGSRRRAGTEENGTGGSESISRSPSLKDVLASGEKGSHSSSSASVPDRLHRKKAASQACSVSLPGDVISKKAGEVRSGSRRRGVLEP